MLIGVAAVVLGGFVIICAAPFTSPRLYKTGGGLFLVSGMAEGALPHVVENTYSDIGHLGLIVYLCITLIQLNVRDETSRCSVVFNEKKGVRCVHERRFSHST